MGLGSSANTKPPSGATAAITDKSAKKTKL